MTDMSMLTWGILGEFGGLESQNTEEQHTPTSQYKHSQGLPVHWQMLCLPVLCIQICNESYATGA